MDNPLALSFGNEAARYERARPEWPPEVADLAHVSSDSTVLDLAAGTGKLTRVLAERFARVIAVEPDEAMRSYITGVEALAGTAEAIPLPDASVDVAFVAEAFHWFDWKRAVAELARVLRPGAPLVLLWNYPRAWEPALPAAVDEALDRRFAMAVGPPGLRIYDSGEWREGFASAPFEPLRKEHVEYEHATDREGVIAWWLTVSGIASLPAAERALLDEELRGLLPEDEYRLPICVHAHVTHRL